jgi:tetratricopeptide (TPR) repeat protein
VDSTTYRRLRGIAITLAVVVVAWMLYDYVTSREPGTTAYLTGNNLFKDGYYERALDSYEEALAENPDMTVAFNSMANSLIQLDRLDEARSVIEEAIARKPGFAGHYATRGIIDDRMGRYEAAMADYARALALDPEIAEGMHWIDRLLYNVQETPSTIADRLRYLREQTALPEDQRLLRVPEIDAEQRPYEQ